MTQENLFQEIAPGDSPLAAAEPVKRRRKANGATQEGQPAKRGRPRKAEASEQPVQRKPRQAPAAGGIKVELRTLISATVGMQADDTNLFARIAETLHNQPKAARDRILSALGKVFA